MDYDALLDLAIEVGFRLEEAGAEIYRVEESITRILTAYQVFTGEVFAIPSCLIVSLTTPDGRALTRVRRVPPHGTDIYRIEAYNALCRRICGETPAPAAARVEAGEILQTTPRYPMPMVLAAHFLAGCFFSLFWGGSLRDGLCSGLCGIAIGLCSTLFSRLGANLFFKTIAGGAISALLALFFAALGLGEHVDKITIGALMLLVPGVAFTNAVRDVMAGDMVSGMAKLSEALLIGTAIALGTGLALTLTQWLGGGAL